MLNKLKSTCTYPVLYAGVCCMCGHKNSLVGKFLSHLFDAHKVNLKLDPTAIWHWRCPLCSRVEPAVGLLQAHVATCAMLFNQRAHLLLAPAPAFAQLRGTVDDDMCYLLKVRSHLHNSSDSSNRLSHQQQ